MPGGDVEWEAVMVVSPVVEMPSVVASRVDEPVGVAVEVVI